jgi:hypothetical protein
MRGSLRIDRASLSACRRRSTGPIGVGSAYGDDNNCRQFRGKSSENFTKWVQRKNQVFDYKQWHNICLKFFGHFHHVTAREICCRREGPMRKGDGLTPRFRFGWVIIGMLVLAAPATVSARVTVPSVPTGTAVATPLAEAGGAVDMLAVIAAAAGQAGSPAANAALELAAAEDGCRLCLSDTDWMARAMRLNTVGTGKPILGPTLQLYLGVLLLGALWLVLARRHDRTARRRAD